MKLESTWRAAASGLQRMQRAVRLFVEPVPAADATDAASKRVPAPFCVSYGRVVFCLYHPQPRPARDGERLER